MPATADLPRFTTLLFGLSGDLVDFGARTLPVALQRSCPDCPPERLTSALALPPQQALDLALGHDADAPECDLFQSALDEAAQAHAEVTPGALDALQSLHRRGIPCGWLDELPSATTLHLAAALDEHLATGLDIAGRQWPAPDSCWQALMQLGTPLLDGCVLVTASPRLRPGRPFGKPIDPGDTPALGYGVPWKPPQKFSPGGKFPRGKIFWGGLFPRETPGF